VRRQQRRGVEVGQEIAVHHQEVVGQVVDDRQRSGAAQRPILDGEIDLEAGPRAGEALADQVGAVAEGDGGAAEAGAGQLPEDDLDDGQLTADGRERLGQRGDAGEARPVAAGHDHRAHGQTW
jgi:hypothetical protein